MTNNTSIIDNTTGNGTFWKPFDVKNLPDVGKLFEDGNNLVSNLLISWNFEPADVYFRVLVMLLGVVILYQIFVSGSSRMGSMFRWVLTVFVVLIILVALGVI